MIFKHILGLLLLCCTSGLLNGQSLGRQMVGSAGGSTRIADLQLSWSMGEVAVGHRSIIGGGGRLTEGFQQPNLMPLNEGIDPSLVQVAPNPVRNMLNMFLPGAVTSEWTVTLSDVNGKVLLRKAGLPAGNSEIDLGLLPSGVYFLSASQSVAGEIGQTIKILKL
jgi:hypothetical protein